LTGPRSEEGPVTVGQRLIWAGQQLSPDSPLYNMAIRADFSVALDPARLGDAFESVVARSDALRASFTTRAGALVQDVRPDVPAGLEHVDLSREADPEDAARRWIDERVRRPLDLGRASYDTALAHVNSAPLSNEIDLFGYEFSPDAARA